MFSRMLTLGVVGAFSKFVVSVMNRATCSNYDTLLHHMTERPRPRGLITVSNHSSTFDDPGVLSYLIPASYFATEPSHNGVRWTIRTRARSAPPRRSCTCSSPRGRPCRSTAAAG